MIRRLNKLINPPQKLAFFVIKSSSELFEVIVGFLDADIAGVVW